MKIIINEEDLIYIEESIINGEVLKEDGSAFVFVRREGRALDATKIGADAGQACRFPLAVGRQPGFLRLV